MTHLYLSKDEETIVSIQHLTTKVTRLKAILAITPFKNVNYFLYGSSGAFIGLDQSMFPMDLSNELKLLLQESIDIYENEIQQLHNSL